MKNTDIALVILISAISIALSYWIGGMIMGNPNEKIYKVNYLDPIASDFQEPDQETFNPTMINPTEEIIIGNCNSETQVEDPETHRCMSKEEYEIKKREENKQNNGDDTGGQQGDNSGGQQGDDNSGGQQGDNSGGQQGDDNSGSGNTNLEY